MNIYRVLGVARDADETAIKRAYAARIKQYRPDTHPTEFAEVREAYEAALRNCRARRQWEAEGEAEPPQEAAEPVSPPGENNAPAPATDYQPERIRAELPVEEGGEARHPATPERIIAADRSDERAETQRAAEAVAAMLAEFEDQPQAGEEEMLQRYRAHLDRVAELPLDAQMDYEQGLRYWLLFSRRPSLAVFREAATRYDWEMRSVEIVRAYGSHAGLRYAAVKKLADLFAEARHARNPFLRIDGNDALLQYRIGDHYRALRAKELSTAWARACEGADLPQLVPRLQLTQGRAWQVYWVDIAIGLFAGWVAWLLLTVKPTPYLWLEVALIGIPSVMLPAFIRGVVRRSRPVWRAAVARLQPLRGKLFAAKSRVTLVVAQLTLIPLLILGVLWILALASSLWVLLLAAGFAFVAWYCYRALARVEAGLVGYGVRLAHFVRWLRTTPNAGRQFLADWKRQTAGKSAALRAYWRTSRTSVFWWLYIFVMLFSVFARVKH